MFRFNDILQNTSEIICECHCQALFLAQSYKAGLKILVKKLRALLTTSLFLKMMCCSFTVIFINTLLNAIKLAYNEFWYNEHLEIKQNYLKNSKCIFCMWTNIDIGKHITLLPALQHISAKQLIDLLSRYLFFRAIKLFCCWFFLLDLQTNACFI